MRAALMAAACTGLLLALPAAGKEGDHALVVQGEHSAYIDFEVVGRPLEVDLEAVALAGGHTFVGVHITSLDRDPPFQLWSLRAPSLSPETLAAGSSLPAGTYRARLLTDGAARAVFPLRYDTPGRVLSPRTPLAVRLRTSQQDVEPGRSDAALRIDAAVPSMWGSLHGFRVTGERLEQTAACLTAEDRCPNLPVPLPRFRSRTTRCDFRAARRRLPSPLRRRDLSIVTRC